MICQWSDSLKWSHGPAVAMVSPLGADEFPNDEWLHLCGHCLSVAADHMHSMDRDGVRWGDFWTSRIPTGW